MTERHPLHRRAILAVLFTGVLMAALDLAIVAPVLPDLKVQFGVDERSVAWVYGIYILAGFAGTPLMAKLSDKVGRRSVYIADVLLFALGSLWVALSPTYGLLLVGRGIQGFAAGGVAPVATAVVGDIFPPEKRGHVLGLLGAVMGVAFVIGPLLAGLLLPYGWRWLFLINLPVAALVVAGTLATFPRTGPATHEPIDWWGAAALVVGTSALTVSINSFNPADAASIATARVAGAFVVAVAALAAFWVREGRAPAPLVRLPVFGRRQAQIVLLLGLGVGLVEASVVFVPQLIVEAFHVTPQRAALMLVPVVIAMTVGAPLAGRALDRRGSRVVLAGGSLLLTLGMVAVSLVDASVVGFYVAATMVGLGMAAVLGAPLRYVLLNESPEGDRSAAQGGLTLSMSVGQLMGGALVGAVVASFGSDVHAYSIAFRVLALVGALMAFATLGLKGRAAERATAVGAAPVTPFP